jgi:hypothetical protein
MECYACSNEATRQCRRCARVYCEVHGGDLCAECLSPASSLPSFNLYRGSLLVLLVGTAIALWLLVRPPGSGDGEEVVITEFTPTPIVTEVLDTPTPSTPAPTTKTPATPATRTPAAITTAEPRQYIVQEGDTLSDIAERFAPLGVDPFEYAAEIVAASDSLVSAEDPLTPGQTLVLP